jgi:hypothetical protein
MIDRLRAFFRDAAELGKFKRLVAEVPNCSGEVLPKRPPLSFLGGDGRLKAGRCQKVGENDRLPRTFDAGVFANSRILKN